MPEPIYTADNIRIAYQLRWSIAVFWKQTALDPASWLADLQQATESDGVRILEHRLTSSNVSQFLASSKAEVAPSQCLRSVKGRLQYLVRASRPKAFRRNYSVHSLGAANERAIHDYVDNQVEHHPMADPRADALLARYQFTDARLNLAEPRRSSHGRFVYNLHFVTVHADRFTDVREDELHRTLKMLQGTAQKRGHLLSRAGLLADHMHWTVACGIDEAPLDVGLSYLNNLAYAHEMRPMFQFGFYVGTFGSYDMNAVRRVAGQSSSHRGEPGGDGESA